MSIGNDDPEWPLVIVSNGRISGSYTHLMMATLGAGPAAAATRNPRGTSGPMTNGPDLVDRGTRR